MQNCGVRLLPLDFRDQYFGCEIELTGINRATAAHALADLFGTRAEHSGGGYDAYRVKDLDGKEWKIVRDGSIHPECRRRSVLIGETYKVELNSPKLEYGEMEKLQEVVRSLRRAGGIVNDSCGMHVHVDASKHTPQSLKNVLSIMYSKEDILFAALKVNPARIDSYCQPVDEPILEEIRKLPSGASMDQLKDRWYRGRDGSIHPECRRRSVLIGETYKVELNSPKLEYGEMEKLQEVVRSLRRAGGIVNDSCGMHVHVDASKHTPQSLKNVLSIMYSKEDILFAALKVNPARIDSYCQAVDEPILEEIRKLPSGASMDQLKDRWYQGRDGSDYHYHSSRYRACYGKKAIMYPTFQTLIVQRQKL